MYDENDDEGFVLAITSGMLRKLINHYSNGYKLESDELEVIVQLIEEISYVEDEIVTSEYFEDITSAYDQIQVDEEYINIK